MSVPAQDAAPSFGRDVRPILSRHCFRCHGPDDAARQADLRLDQSEAATARRDDGGRGLVPSQPDQSLVWKRVTSEDPDLRMPPVEVSPHGVTEAERAVLRRWIEAGATYEPHWSFQPPAEAPLPKLSANEAAVDPIDLWVRHALERKGLSPSEPAEPSVLARRVALDLIGLPPPGRTLEAYLADPTDAAFSSYVDGLLASPHFGEKWARYWLDLARYADTKGYEKDDRRTIWPWRDWVIRALNDDYPLDRFSLEQLAGDLLPDARTEQRLATAFHRNTMNNDEGGTDDEEFRVAAVIDRTNTTFEIWMGLTLGCAQCHTHKFDPITHQDYYRVFAIFNQTADADQPDERPTLRVAVRSDGRAVAPMDSGAEEVGPSAIEVPILREVEASKRRRSHRLVLGNFLSPADPVSPGLPRFLGAPASVTDRLALAQWLFSAQNPLTARVLVNRVWEQLFGRGIVATVEDFGTAGAYPTHPELLDHLAVEFRAQGFHLKRLLRTIVLSRTYRQSSTVRAADQRDPENVFLARGPRLRLDGEQIRDQALTASGLLNPRMFGPPVFPYQPPGLWKMIYSNDDWRTSPGSERHRRALYTFWRRTIPYASLETFDAPSREFCASRRLRTNTPLQAYVTLNDPAFTEAAQALARTTIETSDRDATRLDWMFQRVLVRRPLATELEDLTAHLAAARAWAKANPDAAKQVATDPLGPLPAGPDPLEAAAWTSLARVVLNLDAALTKE